MKTLLKSILLFFLVNFYVGAAIGEYSCKIVKKNNNFTQVCFPIDQICVDEHGIGDGNPIEFDCFTGSTRLCHIENDNWPACAGGIETFSCRKVQIDSAIKKVCFPVGYKCMDLHGIGNGNPIEIDCFTEGTRLCHNGNGNGNWPACAGGRVVE